MSRFQFELAGPANEADLRDVLARTPMAGTIRVAFQREPDYFAGAVVDGRFRQIIACRDTDTGRIIGFGTRSVMERYVNGTAMPIGYLGGLRVLEEYRQRGLVARGFAFFRRQHGDGRTALYLTTIAEGNTTALQTLLGARAGLPSYHFAGLYHTLALPRLRRPARMPCGLEIRPARVDDLGNILGLLQHDGPRRQFFPCYQATDFFHADGIFLGLRDRDIWLAYSGGVLIGMLAAWDQHAYKQSVVCGYSGVIRWLRPLYNAWAALTGSARLPGVGQSLRYRTAALPIATQGEVFAALLSAVRAALTEEHLMLGLHEDDPLWPVVRKLSGPRYTTRLYLACWDDGETLRQSLDGRPPYLELGCL